MTYYTRDINLTTPVNVGLGDWGDKRVCKGFGVDTIFNHERVARFLKTGDVEMSQIRCLTTKKIVSIHW